MQVTVTGKQIDVGDSLRGHVEAATVAEVGDAFALAPLGTRPLRGFAEAVSVFSVNLHDRDVVVPLPEAE